MEEVAICDLNEATDDLPEVADGFGLGHPSALGEEPGQVAVIAELGNDVAVVGCGEHVVAAQDVGVFECFQGFDLALQHFLAEFVAYTLHINDFDGHCLI
jgi:hypothetical protein